MTQQFSDMYKQQEQTKRTPAPNKVYKTWLGFSVNL